MKKTITITLLVIIVLNLISIKTFAADGETSTDGSVNALDEANKMLDGISLDLTPQESGKVNLVTSEGKSISAGITGTSYLKPLLFKGIVNIITVIPQAINQLLDMFIETTTLDNDVDRFTIYDTVLGHYDLFNIDYTNIDGKISDDPTLIEQMRFYVIRFYGLTRRLSVAASLFVLIYIGIRMAVSTIAEDKAKYKKMLVNWVASLVLVYVMFLLVIGLSFILQKGLQIVNDIAVSWKVDTIENDIYSGAISNFTGKGFNVFTSFVIICILTWYQIKFFIYYLKRTLEVNFLIIVSPLVTITYSIDKIGDNRAQAFGAFVKELVTKCSMQLIHAVLYIVFIATAGVIAVKEPLLALLFFAALSRAEKITRRIFTVDDEGFQKAEVFIPKIE